MLHDKTESDIEHERNSADESVENWTGRWMPSQPGEYVPPTKIFTKTSQADVEHEDHGLENKQGRHWIPNKFEDHQFPNTNNQADETHPGYIQMGVKNINCDNGKVSLIHSYLIYFFLII